MSDHAVSPVIGVILMVAITVILAGIVAVFALGMVSPISKTKIISITAEQQEENLIIVMYGGGVDSSSFVYGTVNVTDDNGDYLEVDNLTNKVGSFVIAEGNLKNRNKVVVVGQFSDGSQQVLLDSYV